MNEFVLCTEEYKLNLEAYPIKYIQDKTINQKLYKWSGSHWYHVMSSRLKYFMEKHGEKERLADGESANLANAGW